MDRRDLEDRSLEVSKELEYITDFEKFKNTPEFKKFILEGLIKNKMEEILLEASSVKEDAVIVAEVRAIAMLQSFFSKQINIREKLTEEKQQIRDLLNNL